MSSLHNLRPRRGSEQKYIEIDSETEEEETDTIAEGDTSSEDSEGNTGVSASKSDNNVDASEARPSSSRGTARSRRQHLPLSSRTRAPTISPTHSTDRTVDLDLARLYIERAANLQTNSNQTTNMSDTNTNPLPRADTHPNLNQAIKNMAEADPTPVPCAPKRITSEPALRDANGRAKQRSEKGLSSQSENGDANDGRPQEFDKENRVYLTPRRQLNFSSRYFLKKALRRDPPLYKSKPKRQVEETAQDEETARPEEEAEEPAPARDGLSHANVLPEYGYGYGYDVADTDEPSFFRDELAAIEARNARIADSIESSIYNEVLHAFERRNFYMAGARTQYPEMAGETGGYDSWMEEFLNMDEFEN